MTERVKKYLELGIKIDIADNTDDDVAYDEFCKQEKELKDQMTSEEIGCLIQLCENDGHTLNTAKGMHLNNLRELLAQRQALEKRGN